MASVIREGGSNPITINDWRTALQVSLLEKMYDEGQRGAHKNDLWYNLRHHFCKEDDILPQISDHQVNRLDMDLELRGMLVLGLVEVAEYPCECCRQVERSLDDTLTHAVRFRLTKAGYDRVPEHIFP